MIIKSTDEEIKKHVSKAIIRITRERNIYSYLLLNIPIVIDKTEDKDTGGYGIYSTDKAIYFNTNCKENMLKSFKEVNYDVNILIKHEMLHMILKHIKRMTSFVKSENKVMSNFNVAADYLINKEIGLDNNNFVNAENIKKNYGIEEHIIAKKTAEEITRILDKKDKTTTTINNMAKNIFIDEIESGGDTKEVEDEIKKNANGFKDISSYFKNLVKNGLVINRNSIGKENSDFWKQLDDELFESKYDYKTILYNYLNKNFKGEGLGNKYVNRRYYQLKNQIRNLPISFNNYDIILNNLLICIDTSGSISDEVYKKEIGEILNIANNIGIEGTICLFDTTIKRTIKINRQTNRKELFKELMKRSDGGTDFNCIKDMQEKTKPRVTLILSDLYATYPNKFIGETIFITYSTEYPKEAKEHGKVYKINMN